MMLKTPETAKMDHFRSHPPLIMSISDCAAAIAKSVLSVAGKGEEHTLNVPKDLVLSSDAGTVIQSANVLVAHAYESHALPGQVGVIGSLRNMVAGVKEGVIGKEKRLFAAVRSPDKKTTHLMLLKSEEKEHLTPDIGFTSTHGFEIPTLEGVCITKLSDEVFRFTPKTQIHEPKEHKAKKIMGVVFRGEEVTMIRLRRIDPE